MREIVEKINTLEKRLKVDKDALEENQAEAKTQFNKKLENDKKQFDKKQTQERINFNERQNNAKIQLHKEHEKKIKDLEAKLQSLTSPPTAAAPPTPECPVCLDPMAPPVRIFTCPNGHLVCADCKEKMEVATCPLCYEPVKGRATAMEQMLVSLYNLE